MERMGPAHLMEAIKLSPAWCRVGLTAPSEHLREKAIEELALSIVDFIDPPVEQDRNQLALPLGIGAAERRSVARDGVSVRS
jgi:hypothetical protein